MLHSKPLLPKTTMNDLGIIVSKDLKWKPHINKIISEANQRLWLLIRTLGYDAPKKANKMAFISMVHSILEYSSPPMVTEQQRYYEMY